MKRLAIIGASGLLGTSLRTLLRSHYDLLATAFTQSAPGLEKLDIRSPEAYRAFLDFQKPNVVVHCAALTDLERCEHYPEEAEALNVKPVELLAEWAARHGAKVVFISTDAVFGGRKGGYRETDATGPINVYGATKLRAEQALAALPEALLLRVAVLYGPDLTNRKFLANTIAKLKTGQLVTGATDVIRSPTLTDDIAFAMQKLLLHDASGVYHVTGATRVDMYEAACEIARVFGYDEKLVRPIVSTDILIGGVPSIVQRAGDTSLDCSRLAGAAIRMRSLREGLSEVKNQLNHME